MSDAHGKAVYGDFQTPPELARQVCEAVARRFGSPAAVLEPTCGIGGLLVAACRTFGPRVPLHGIEIDGGHVARAEAALRAAGAERFAIEHADFFDVDWPAVVAAQPQPLCVVGNPPWVTNAALGALGAVNLPPKRNADGLGGLEALTGKSNFDISEWMCRRLLEVLAGRDAVLAVLVKTAVARKVLAHAWRNDWPISDAEIVRIDAATHFGAAVDACLLVARTRERGDPRAAIYADFGAEEPDTTLGYDDGELIADLDAHAATRHLLATADDAPPWRSGIKHDCARVLELRDAGGRLVNGIGEVVGVEPQVLYPLLKSSDVARGRASTRWLLVPQRETGEDPARLQDVAPWAWGYLQRHGERLDARKSSIYRDRPRFSVFGVGPYSFTPWKIAISGLYKSLEFRVIGPHDGRPVVFDDTVYLLPCDDEAHARRVHASLSSPIARRFFDAHVFWDAKRPITASVLRRLSLRRLAASRAT